VQRVGGACLQKACLRRCTGAWVQCEKEKRLPLSLLPSLPTLCCKQACGARFPPTQPKLPVPESNPAVSCLPACLQPREAEERGPLQLLDAMLASSSASAAAGLGGSGYSAEAQGGAVPVPQTFLEEFGARFRDEEGLEEVLQPIGVCGVGWGDSAYLLLGLLVVCRRRLVWLLWCFVCCCACCRACCCACTSSCGFQACFCGCCGCCFFGFHPADGRG
jgi:hypothetical protein